MKALKKPSNQFAPTFQVAFSKAFLYTSLRNILNGMFFCFLQLFLLIKSIFGGAGYHLGNIHYKLQTIVFLKSLSFFSTQKKS